MSVDYKDPEEPAEDDLDPAEELPILDGEALNFQSGEEEFAEDAVLPAREEFEPPDHPPNKKAARFSLPARRAIEDHLEQRRLRKEIDYLFDDEFAEGSDERKSRGS